MFGLVIFLCCLVAFQSLAAVGILAALLIRADRRSWKLSRAALVDEATFAQLERAEEQRKAPKPRPQPRLPEPELPADLAGFVG